MAGTCKLQLQKFYLIDPYHFTLSLDVLNRKEKSLRHVAKVAMMTTSR